MSYQDRVIVSKIAKEGFLYIQAEIKMQTDQLVENLFALLGVSESIISHRDLSSLFQDLVSHLGKLLDFEAIILSLYDPVTNKLRRHVLEISDSTGTLSLD